MNPNDDPILARINNTLPRAKFPQRKRKFVESHSSNKRQRTEGWRRTDLYITIPTPAVVFGEEECDHQWTPQPRMMGEHTTYECGICGEESGCA